MKLFQNLIPSLCSQGLFNARNRDRKTIWAARYSDRITDLHDPTMSPFVGIEVIWTYLPSGILT